VQYYGRNCGELFFANMDNIDKLYKNKYKM
jgi:hypothetical protein